MKSLYHKAENVRAIDNNYNNEDGDAAGTGVALCIIYGANHHLTPQADSDKGKIHSTRQGGYFYCIFNILFNILYYFILYYFI